MEAILPKTAFKIALKIAIRVFSRGLKSKSGYFLGLSKKISDEQPITSTLRVPPPGGRKHSSGPSENRRLMSQSIQTGNIPPPGNPRENFLSEPIPAARAIFCLISLPRGKNNGRISVGGAKFSQTRRNYSLSLQKSSKN